MKSTGVNAHSGEHRPLACSAGPLARHRQWTSSTLGTLYLQITQLALIYLGRAAQGYRPAACAPRNALLLALLLAFLPLHAQEKRGLDGITVKPLSSLSDHFLSRLGEQALGVEPASWQHAETENFIYHFQSGTTATAVSIEAEFYYRVIAADLEKDRSHWQRKAHIFIFEKPEQWTAFQSAGGLDPWTGGLNTGNELFLLRDASMRWKGSTLGHETAHLVVNRFFPGIIPLWLNEGYSENVAKRAYASFYRARGYLAKPMSRSLSKDALLPLDRLMNLPSYPQNVVEVETFYVESEQLVRFLMDRKKSQFLAFFTALASGATNESALRSAYGSDFSSVKDLEEKFRKTLVTTTP